MDMFYYKKKTLDFILINEKIYFRNKKNKNRLLEEYSKKKCQKKKLKRKAVHTRILLTK